MLVYLQLSNAISAFREVEAAYQVKGGACVFNVLIDICCRMGEVRSSTYEFLRGMFFCASIMIKLVCVLVRIAKALQITIMDVILEMYQSLNQNLYHNWELMKLVHSLGNLLQSQMVKF